jgi:hypothetical protein
LDVEIEQLTPHIIKQVDLMKLSNLIVLASTFLITTSLFAVPTSEHATVYEEFEGQADSRQAKVPGLTQLGQQLPLFPKPPVLLQAFSSRGPKWKKLAESYVYDNFSEEISHGWELDSSVDAINENNCNGLKNVSWRNISDDYVDELTFSWESVKVEKSTVSSTKKGSTVLYLVTLEAFLVYDYTDENDVTTSYTCTVPVDKFVIKNKKIKSYKEMNKIFLGKLQ